MSPAPTEPTEPTGPPSESTRPDEAGTGDDGARSLAELDRKIAALAEAVERNRIGPATKGLGCLAILMLFYIAANMGLLRGLLREVLRKLP